MRSAQESEVVLVGPHGEALVQKTPGVCGGDACIGNTRIMVWLLVAMRQGGFSDERILSNYPGLMSEDLAAAYEYYKLQAEEIEDAIANQEVEED